MSGTEAEAIADLARRGGDSYTVTHGGRTFLITPNDVRSQEITDAQEAEDLRRVIQGVTVQTAGSLINYVERFGGDDTVLFADIAANSITALVDYHSAADGQGVITPAHVDHRAILVLPFSEEWAAWKAIHGRLMPQVEFARFIEENAADVEAPSGADLLEIVRDLQAVRKADFRKVVRTASGVERFEYSETESAKAGDVEVPTKFQLRLPVYFDGETVELYAYLRWKLEDGDLKLGVALHRAEHVRQAVFKQVVNSIADRTTRPAMFGKAS